jgi:hypothetical protein
MTEAVDTQCQIAGDCGPGAIPKPRNFSVLFHRSAMQSIKGVRGSEAGAEVGEAFEGPCHTWCPRWQKIAMGLWTLTRMICWRAKATGEPKSMCMTGTFPTAMSAPGERNYEQSPMFDAFYLEHVVYAVRFCIHFIKDGTI